MKNTQIDSLAAPTAKGGHSTPSVPNAVSRAAGSTASDHLRRLCLIYTCILLAFNLIECVGWGQNVFPGPLSLVYLALLAAYAGEKEIRQWSLRMRTAAPDAVPEATPARRGEIFVYVWTIFLLAASFLSAVLPNTCVIPHELGQITLQVIGVFFGTHVSKAIRGGKLAAGAALGPAEPSLAGPQTAAKQILRALKEAGPLTATEISNRVGLEGVHVRRVLGGLMRSGWVVRAAPGPGSSEPRYQAR